MSLDGANRSHLMVPFQKWDIRRLTKMHYILLCEFYKFKAFLLDIQFLLFQQVSNTGRMQASLSVGLVQCAQPVFYFLQTYI